MKKIISLLFIISSLSPKVFAAPQESIEDKTLDIYITETISDVIKVASNEVGYLEKDSGKALYETTADAGTSNYTKYSYDMVYYNFYSCSMQGQPWCDIFVDWCFCQAFGAALAKEITYQVPYGSAACSSSKQAFESAGQYFKTPQPGDQIFFGGSHTGLVYKTEGNTVYTIEGNTNSNNGVVSNGEGVSMKSYSLDSSRITGYGRPNYSKIAELRKADEEEKQRVEQEKEKQRRLQQLRNSMQFPEFFQTQIPQM